MYAAVRTALEHTENVLERSRKRYTSLFVAIVALGLALSGCATPDTRPVADQDVRAAQQTLSNLEKDPEMPWFRDNLRTRALSSLAHV